MAYGLGDVVQQRRMIDQSPGERSYKMRLGQHLDAMLALCETVGCRRQNLLGYFGEASGPCGNCDTCLAAPETWDGLVPAQKLLSTIVRLQRERGQAFGAGHLIDILRGSSTDRIRQQGHDALTTYGLGADLTDQDWRSVIRQLLARGILVPKGEYGTLALGEPAGGVLRGDGPVPLRRDVLGRTGAGGSSRARKASASDALDAADRPVFESLREWRAGVAKEQGMPAYIVFGDATLRALAEHRPATLNDLDGITGIGAKKREAYGSAVLAVISGARQ
jgi:ATP-dependent DNA helicase RecQ